MSLSQEQKSWENVSASVTPEQERRKNEKSNTHNQNVLTRVNGLPGERLNQVLLSYLPIECTSADICRCMRLLTKITFMVAQTITMREREREIAVMGIAVNTTDTLDTTDNWEKHMGMLQSDFDEPDETYNGVAPVP